MTEVRVPRELLPCPFCGSSEVEIYCIRIRDNGGQQAHCGQCGAAAGPEFDGRADDPTAHERSIVAWNTRAHPTSDPSAVIAAARKAESLLRVGSPPFSAKEVAARRTLKDALDAYDRAQPRARSLPPEAG